MTFQGLITLTTFSHGISADIFQEKEDLSPGDKLATLNSRNFAFVFYFSDLLEVISEMGKEKRYLMVIENSDNALSRFALAFTFDNLPLQLLEGSGLFFPNNMQIFFMYKNLQSDIFSLNIKTEKTKFQFCAKLNEKDLDLPIDQRLSLENCDYKTDIGSENEIEIPPEFIKGKFFPSVDIIYYPQELFKLPEEGAHVLSLEDLAIISVDTKIQ